MAERVRVELISSGVQEVLRSESVRSRLGEVAQRVADRANESMSSGAGYEASSTIGRRRALAIVTTETFEAMGHEAKHHTLPRAAEEVKRG